MSESRLPLQKALLSVSDKSGLDLLCKALHSQGVELFSTGGTAEFIRTQGLPVTPIESLTDFPEILEGRVKTLHPKVYGGILARRDHSNDQAEISRLGLTLFDLLVVNFYPFQDHLGKSFEEQAAFIDIGGPALIRAGSKNHRWVTVLSDPTDYSLFLRETKDSATTSLDFRREMAKKSFLRVSRYDAAIFTEWEKPLFPMNLTLYPQKELRYGENPHQKAVWSGCPEWKVLQGKELSYNNLLDTESANQLVSEFEEPAVAIIKHNNPCAVAWGEETSSVLFERAFETDSKSSFGGIVAFNIPVDKACALKMSEVFLEVVIAPAFLPEALSVLENKKNLRLIEWPHPSFSGMEVRTAMGGWLVQQKDSLGNRVEFKLVNQENPTKKVSASEMKGAWIVCKHARSNAIVIVKNNRTVGIGAGQVSRVDSMKIAIEKAQTQLNDTVIASDAFFPFRDSIDLLRGLGVKAVLQPGGSQRDAEVIEACSELGIPLYFTGERHFRH
jgi:phosphoribosylaminoimidazolecarboxamide formyltransferase/IMP cyclohydrolase